MQRNHVNMFNQKFRPRASSPRSSWAALHSPSSPQESRSKKSGLMFAKCLNARKGIACPHELCAPLHALDEFNRYCFRSGLEQHMKSKHPCVPLPAPTIPALKKKLKGLMNLQRQLEAEVLPGAPNQLLSDSDEESSSSSLPAP